MSNSCTLVTMRGAPQEVEDGLLLYRNATNSRASDESVRNRWAALLRGNPFTEGITTVAMESGKVVGSYSLIPLMMDIDGRSVLAAKGEFYVVHPDYRRALDSASRKVIGLALVEKTKAAAKKCGVLLSYGVAALKARAVASLTADLSFRQEIDSWYLPLRATALKDVNSFKRKFLLAGVILRNRFLIRRLPRCRQVETTAENLSDRFHVGCRLVSSQASSLAFRFPHSDYAAIEVPANDRMLPFVFTNAHDSAWTDLKCWDSLDLTTTAARNLLAKLVETAQSSNAMGVRLQIPRSASHLAKVAKTAGFLLKGKEEICINFSVFERDLLDSLKRCDWKMDNSHVGIYQELRS